MKNRNSRLVFLVIVLILVTAGCSSGGEPSADLEAEEPTTEAVAVTTEEPTQPPEEPAPVEPTSLPPTEAPAPTEVPQEEPEPTQWDLSPCEQEVCIESGSFVLMRPISASGRQTVDPSFRYGEYRQSTRLTHRGVDFLNSSGTPVVAAADGMVVVAGDDLDIPYGPRKDYYGNLLILEHNLPGMPDPIFTLYSQLSEVLVEEGQSVAAGEEIALVGMTGAVPGSTLHFEVRLGENSYQEARNPELWLQLMSDERGQQLGALAGRVLDGEGNYLPVDNIVLEQLAGEGLPAIDQFYLKTYGKEELRGQYPWNESFAISDLAPGDYQITFMLNGLQQMVVKVEPGKLVLVTFVLE